MSPFGSWSRSCRVALQPSPGFLGIHAIHLDPLVARGGSRLQPDRAAWNPQRAAEQPKHRLIRLAFSRGRGHPDLEDAFRRETHDLIRSAPGRHAELEPHAGRCPKSAEPIRTIVAPSSIAISKSSDMPIERSA